MAASTMWAGVGKSGSPAPKPMTSSPWAWSALALASTARVADGDTALMRAEILAWTRLFEVDVTDAMIPYMPDTPDISIPTSLLPKDGRYGSGPSKVRLEQVEALAGVSTTYLGTSHRQKTVKSVVGEVRAGLREL